MYTLNDGGAMGAAMREFDWEASPLGTVEAWPQALKTATGILLSSKFPMFLAWGPELTFLYNDSYAAILGDKHPAALGQPFQQVWAEIWPDISPIVDRALAGEATFWENLPLTMNRRGHDELTWFTFSYSPLRADDGSVSGMFCACTETTAQVRSEQHRGQQMDRLRVLLDEAPSFMAVVGRDERFYLANRAYLRSIGKEDIVGRSFTEVFPEEDYPGSADRIREVLRSGEAYSAEGVPVTLKSPGGGPDKDLVLDYLVQPIVERGEVIAVFVAGNDVTARHMAERRLRESEQRFKLIADSAPVPIWVTRPDRTRDFVNQAYLEFVGQPEEEAKRFDWRTILHPDDHDRIVQESIAGEATLKPFSLEARYRNAAGAWRWIRSTSQPRWGPDGEPDGFIGVAHDVTEAKEAEAALRDINLTLEKRVAERTADLQAALDRLQQETADRERAEEALRQAQKMEAVGRLTGGIAHDFNNLLTPIIGGLELITRQVDDPRLQRLAQAALDSGRRGAKLATQLLAFSRLQRLAMTPVDANRVIEEMGQILRHTIGPRIQIRTELDTAAGHALCDANQLENAILNLAINARDAMPDGGRLTISTRTASEPEGPDLPAGDYVGIVVEDSGHGMPPEVAARAFEPFFSTKPVGKGTGLGLAQVYGIAKQSGGTVRIESREGTGTRVTILLPRVCPAEAAADAPALAPTGAGNAGALDILIVDDDADVRAFMADALQSLGHTPHVADGPEAGLRRLDESEPDLVMLDFAMPGMNGAELAQEIRARRADLPIVFVTGYAESDQLAAAVGTDVPVLRKPFTLDELAALIARAPLKNG
jgi:PAS domain S-box-containing protein